MGTFGLPLEQVQEVVSKVWPCFGESIKQEAERPLKEKLTRLKCYMQKKVDWLDELNSNYEDLWIRYKELKESCKAKEMECNNLVAKSHHLKGHLEACKVEGAQP
jgi:hypothetical protein